MFQTTERIRTKWRVHVLDADRSQTQGAKYDKEQEQVSEIRARKEKKAKKKPHKNNQPQNHTILLRKKDFFVIIKTTSTKAITQLNFYFDTWFGYFFFYVMQL